MFADWGRIPVRGTGERPTEGIQNGFIAVMPRLVFAGRAESQI